MLIAFAGPDGSGKSSQVSRTASWLKSEGHIVAILDKWDILNKSKFNECRFMHDDLDDLRVCIAEMNGVSRAMFLFWSIAITLTKDTLHDRGRIFLLDGYWMKHAAAEVVYGCSEAWVLQTVDQLPQPDLTFYFDVSPEVALSRKRGELTPYECGRKLNYTEEDFLSHQKNLRSFMNEWANRFGWIKITTLQDPNHVFSAIQRNINLYLRKDKECE